MITAMDKFNVYMVSFICNEKKVNTAINNINHNNNQYINISYNFLQGHLWWLGCLISYKIFN